MRRALVVSIGMMLVVGVLWAGSAPAQGQEYILQDYMPQTIGSKWTMKSAGEGGGTTTMEVLEPRKINDHQAMPIVTKTAEGRVRMGSLESVTLDKYMLFGTIFGGRGDEGGEPRTILYEPAATFPGKLKVGQKESASFKSRRGEREFEATMSIELAAVEAVTVPKGTFQDCLKLVSTTSFGEREMKRTIWYAKGVGIVKRESPGRNGQTRTTELVDYELGQ